MQWREIESFRPKLPPLDSKLLPAILKEYLLDVSSRMGVPLESLSASSIIGLSSLLGRKVAIYPNALSSDWSEYANLWGMIIGRPSLKKSSTVEQAITPLLSWEKAKNGQYERVRKLITAKIDKCVESIGLCRGVKDEQLQEEIVHLTRRKGRLEKLLKRIRPTHFVANDVTYSALLKVLEKNSSGVFVFRDELGGWFRQLKRPDRASERYLYLEGWRGKTSRRSETARSNIYLEAVCLSVLGATHPATMDNYIGEMEGGIFNDGLINRFSLIIYPDSEFISRSKTAPNFLALKRYEELFSYFKDLKSTSGGLHFSREAQVVFDAWEESLQKKFYSQKEYPVLLEFHLSKYPKAFCALSLIFEKIFEFQDGRPSVSIRLEAAKLARSWCDYLELHAKKLFKVEDYKASPEVKEVIRRIEMGHITSGMSVREIQRIDTPLLSRADSIKEALSKLEESNWLKVHYHGRKGRVQLNPKLLDVGGEVGLMQ